MANDVDGLVLRFKEFSVISNNRGSLIEITRRIPRYQFTVAALRPSADGSVAARCQRENTGRYTWIPRFVARETPNYSPSYCTSRIPRLTTKTTKYK